ncbi:MAG: TldD/PmbA family protein [Thaumarchaeota archaeon]|nr:TldD/PmbA family protein [Nitrososphaerota archaeon]
MEPEKLTERVIAKALELGATDAVVEVYIGRERRIKFANNEIAVFEERDERSVDIFVAIRERRAEISVNGLNVKYVDEAVKQAIQLARLSSPADVYAPLPKGPFRYDERLLKAYKIRGYPDRLVDAVEAAINAALAEGAERAAGTLIYSTGKTWLRTSGGAYGEAEDSSIEISIRAMASNGGSGHFVSIAAREEDFNPEEAGRIAGEHARLSRNPVELKPGEYEVILGPMTFANIVEEVGEAASAFHIDSGLSFLADKLDKEVASRIFTLVDDPTIPGTYGASPFDDEGLPTRRNTIIEEGVLKTYLHNSTTAKKFNTESTANAGLIVPQPFNLIVEARGGESLEKLISDIDDGVYITNDWYLRYHNYQTGDFSTIPRDAILRIRKGGIDGAVKNIRISDNFIRLLKNIRRIGEKRYWISWWEVETPVYAPHALIDRLNLTKPHS